MILDGSKESLMAADVACSLSRSQASTLTAISVVDTKAIWELLGCSAPGLIGSGPYFQAYEKIKESLRTISETLVNSFEATKGSSSALTESTIVEGDPFHEILERSKDFDLLIMGRHGLSQRSSSHNALAERLAATCPCPFLAIIPEKEIQVARLIIDSKTSNKDEVIKFCKLTRSAKLQPEIAIVGDDTNTDELVAQVKTWVPETVRVFTPDSLDGDDSFAVAVDVPGDTLLVFLTVQDLEGRAVARDVYVRHFFSTLSQASILLFPPSICN